VGLRPTIAKQRSGALSEEERKAFAREGGDRVDVRAVVHLAREEQHRAVAAVEPVEICFRIVEIEIDAVRDGPDIGVGQLGLAGEEPLFRLADEQRDIGARGGAAFEGKQLVRLAGMDPAHRARGRHNRRTWPNPCRRSP
jgi:hypothetical protein